MHHTPQPRGLTGPRPGFKLGMGGSDLSLRDNPRSFNARVSVVPTPNTVNVRSDDLTEAVETIIEYLTTRNFPYMLSVDDFVHFQPSQARDVCHFLITRLDPLASFDTIEDDLPNFLRILKYPATVTKSQLRNSPQRGTETLISAFCWLVKILAYIETCVPELSESEFLPTLLEAYGKDYSESRGSRSSSRIGQMHDRQCVVALSKFVEHNERQTSELASRIEETLTVEQNDLDQLVFLLLRCRRLFDDESETEEINQKGIFCYQYMLRVMKAQLGKRQEQFIVEKGEVVKDIARMHGHMKDLEKLKAARAAFESDTAGIMQQITTFKSQAADCQRKLAEAQQALSKATEQANEQEHRTNLGRAEAEAQEDRAAEVERLQAGIRELQDEIKSLEKDQTFYTLELTRLTSTLHAKVEPMSRDWQRCFKQLYNIAEADHPEIDAVVREIRNLLSLDASDVGETLKTEKWFDLDSLLKRHETDGQESGFRPEQALRTITKLMQELNSALERETTTNLAPENCRLEQYKRQLSETCAEEHAAAKARLKESAACIASLKFAVHELQEKETEAAEALRTDEAEIERNLRKKEEELETLLLNRAARRKKMKTKHYRDDEEIVDLSGEIQRVQLQLLEKIKMWEDEFEPQIDQVAEEEILRYTEMLPSQLQDFITRQDGWPGRKEIYQSDSEDLAAAAADVENCMVEVPETVFAPSDRDIFESLAERAIMKQQATPTHRRRQRHFS